jgi:phage baseplate assembly protein W
MSNFLGIGFKFPFSVGPNGGIQLSRYEPNIEESVRIIIGTALGERQMRPDWGCRIHDFVFAPNNTSTQTWWPTTEEALAKHEFRIRNIEVEAMPTPTARSASWSTFATRSGPPTASTTRFPT